MLAEQLLFVPRGYFGAGPCTCNRALTHTARLSFAADLLTGGFCTAFYAGQQQRVYGALHGLRGRQPNGEGEYDL